MVTARDVDLFPFLNVGASGGALSQEARLRQEFIKGPAIQRVRSFEGPTAKSESQQFGVEIRNVIRGGPRSAFEQRLAALGGDVEGFRARAARLDEAGAAQQVTGRSTRPSPQRVAEREEVFARPTVTRQLGQPPVQTTARLRTEQGRTTFDPPQRLQPAIVASPAFAGKAATVEELDVRTFEGPALEQRGPGVLGPSPGTGRATVGFRAGFQPATGLLEPELQRPEEQVVARREEPGLFVGFARGGVPKGPFETARRPENIFTAMTEAQARTRTRAEVAGEALSRGFGVETPFFPGRRLVTVEGETFIERLGFVEGAQRGLGIEPLPEVEQTIQEFRSRRRDITEADIAVFRRQKEQQAIDIGRIEARIESLKELGRDQQQRDKAKPPSEVETRVFGQRSRFVVSPGQFERAEAFDIKKLTRTQRVELGFREEFQLPVTREAEQLAGPLVGTGLLFGVGAAVVPTTAAVTGGVLSGFEAGRGVVTGVSRVRAGEDPFRVTGALVPTVGTETALLGVGVAPTLRTGAGRLRARVVEGTVLETRVTGVTRGVPVTAVERVRVGEVSQVRLSQRTPVTVATEEVTTNLLGRVTRRQAGREQFVITTRGAGFEREGLGVLRTRTGAARITGLDFETGRVDPLRRVTQPRLRTTEEFPVSRGAFRFEEQTFTGEVVSIRPEFGRTVPVERLQRSLPVQTRERTRILGRTVSQEPDRTLTTRLVFTEGVLGGVSPFRPFFTLTEAREAFTLPRGPLAGQQIGATRRFGEIVTRPVVTFRRGPEGITEVRRPGREIVTFVGEDIGFVQRPARGPQFEPTFAISQEREARPSPLRPVPTERGPVVQVLQQQAVTRQVTRPRGVQPELGLDQTLEGLTARLRTRRRLQTRQVSIQRPRLATAGAQAVFARQAPAQIGFERQTPVFSPQALQTRFRTVPRVGAGRLALPTEAAQARAVTQLTSPVSDLVPGRPGTPLGDFISQPPPGPPRIPGLPRLPDFPLGRERGFFRQRPRVTPRGRFLPTIGVITGLFEGVRPTQRLLTGFEQRGFRSSRRSVPTRRFTSTILKGVSGTMAMRKRKRTSTRRRTTKRRRRR